MLLWARRPLAAFLLWVKIWVKEIAAYRKHKRPVDYLRMPIYPGARVSKNKSKRNNFTSKDYRQEILHMSNLHTKQKSAIEE